MVKITFIYFYLPAPPRHGGDFDILPSDFSHCSGVFACNRNVIKYNAKMSVGDY
jgi:hypothetical protein